MTLFPADPNAEVGPVPRGFNWGAFLFTPLFLLWYGRIGPAILLFGVSLISSLMYRGACLILIGVPVALVAGLVVAIKANQIAWETQRFQNYAELQKSMLGWNIAGVIAVALFVAGALMK